MRFFTKRAMLTAGDWACRCGCLSPASTLACEACRAPRPNKNVPTVGSWHCQAAGCAAANQAARQSCWACGVLRGERESDVTFGNATMSHRGGGGGSDGDASQEKLQGNATANGSLQRKRPQINFLAVDPREVQIATRWRCRCGFQNQQMTSSCCKCRRHRSMTQSKVKF